MAREDLDLRDLAAFVTVARHRNFRRAAAELQVSPSSLSENLRDLEARLGVRLLNRTTRSVAPTEAGERLLSRLTPALRDVRDAVSDVQGQRNIPAGRLRINAASPAVQHVLAPMVGPFPEATIMEVPTINAAVIADIASRFEARVRRFWRFSSWLSSIPTLSLPVLIVWIPWRIQQHICCWQACCAAR